MRRTILISTLLSLLVIVPPPATSSASSDTGPRLLAFILHNNVWVARGDGSGSLQLTRDGTGTTTVNGRQVTYEYLRWAPSSGRLLVARFSSVSTGASYRQGWVLQIWTPGTVRLTTLAAAGNGADFDPQWSDDGRSVIYMAESRYNDHTTMFRNTIAATDLSGKTRTLSRYDAHEGCLDSSTDPSELTFWSNVGPGGIRQSFIWSTSGRSTSSPKLEFTIYSTQCIHTGLIYRNLSSGHVKAVGRWAIEAASSPDGTLIAGVEGQHLFLARADGSGRRSIARAMGARLPTWSPDGRFVYFVTRKTLRTLKYRDRTGNLFEFTIMRSTIARLDVASGQIHIVVSAPAHAFANLAASPDGRWLYCTRITNSDVLYRHLVPGAAVTNDLLQRYGPRTDVVRISVAGGQPQVVTGGAGGVTASGAPVP